MTRDISIQDPRLKPVTPVEMTESLNLLFSGLPIKGGADPQSALTAYVIALQGSPAWAIENAVRRFLRGSVDGASRSFCPRPPELSAVVRGELQHVYDELDRKKRAAEMATGRVNDRRPRAPERKDIPRGPLLERFSSAAEGLKLMRSRTWPQGCVFVFREGCVYGPFESM